ncbi:hypothetical protein ACQ9BO_03255 [Flavobacterium sp. P21]|uniref:hypothetical protein n=1 Tax=Flavobacterium sp. P21 TaxID=3423948 RepID=UPI003D671261
MKSSKIKNNLSSKIFKTQTYFLLMFLFFITSYASAIPSNFTTKEIKFVSEGISLAGTIFMPNNAQVAVVIVHGSGQEKE